MAEDHIKKSIDEYLAASPWFRERENRDEGLLVLLRGQYLGLENAIRMGVLKSDETIHILRRFASMDRLWRMALQNNPALRGTDYEDKEDLEAEVQSDLGYNIAVGRKQERL